MAAYTTIDNPELYFQVKTYTGNGSTQSITLDGDENMSPNLVWIKARSSAQENILFDTVRGVTNWLQADTTAVEADQNTSLTSFDSDGFSLADIGEVNANTYTYVAWCWKETADAGFDIVTFTGNGSARTISHSLSAKPDFFVVKGRTFVEQWECYHTSLGATKCLQWDDNSAQDDLAGRFNDTEPTSSVFTVGDADAVNKNTEDFVAYLWKGKQGFSKFGKFRGNHNNDGVFVYLGFRPAYLMVKRYDASEGWYIYDSKRDTYNAGNLLRLYVHANDEESAAMGLDLLSNGFKMRNTDGGHNRVGDYAYMAFAEAPFVNSNGVPCNAR